jgi:hypothetical protein
MENETALNVRGITPVGVCWGAANHAYRGQWGNTYPFDGLTTDVYSAPELLYDPPTDDLTPADIANFHKGDVLYLSGLSCSHIVTVTADGSSTVWEFNGLSGSEFGKTSLSSYLSWQTGGYRRVRTITWKRKP